MTTPSTPNPPIVCDMTGATDTAPERLAAYAALFADALVGRERTGDGIRFRFAARPGVEARVRELAAREHACCGFFTFAVTTHDHEVWWDASVVDDDVARAILDEFFALPDTVSEDVAALHARFSAGGLRVVNRGVQVTGFDAANTVQPIGGVESERSAP